MMARRLAWQLGRWWEDHGRCHGRRSSGQNDRQTVRQRPRRSV